LQLFAPARILSNETILSGEKSPQQGADNAPMIRNRDIRPRGNGRRAKVEICTRCVRDVTIGARSEFHLLYPGERESAARFTKAETTVGSILARHAPFGKSRADNAGL
jgi:hypothetical protein